MKKYRLLAGYSVNSLEEEVNKFLAAGWEPHGSPSVSETTSNGDYQATYIQAVTKEENKGVRKAKAD